MLINYCGISGGKDSAATALWLIHESGEPRESIRFTFCDTVNEHQLTYDHIEMLSGRFREWGAPAIVRLQAKHPKTGEPMGFVDLAKWKRRFPSRRARFCTQFLKVIPSREDVMALLRQDHEVIVHSGVRAAESFDRAKLPARGFDDMFGCVVNRPLLRWSFQDVLDYHKRFDVPMNPLYSYGATRVGCFPCINSNKRELKLISINFPERIDEIREQEKTVGSAARGHVSTFFHRRTVPERYRTGFDPKSGLKICTIDDVVTWSKTGKGAIVKGPKLFEDEPDRGLVCPSGAGMCE